METDPFNIRMLVLEKLNSGLANWLEDINDVLSSYETPYEIKNLHGEDIYFSIVSRNRQIYLFSIKEDCWYLPIQDIITMLLIGFIDGVAKGEDTFEAHENNPY
jgi:hypothetical protein